MEVTEAGCCEAWLCCWEELPEWGGASTQEQRTDLEKGLSCRERTLVLLGSSVVDRGAMRSISVTRVQGRQSQASRTKRSGHRVGVPY